MKITIDTNSKTIKVEETVNFCDLEKELKKLLGKELESYSILPTDFKFISYPLYQTPIWVDPKPYTYPVYTTALNGVTS
jgi:hypothetical protein